MSKFPGPYINDTGPQRENDPMMKRVQTGNMDIGARPSGMPRDVKSTSGTIDHVGGSAGGKK
ncbi:MAG: hypothetical protein KGL39_56705 [Patescibacteria group bacterium]|nr:hypothetical protein [Patescibacteria group bacterium]